MRLVNFFPFCLVYEALLCHSFGLVKGIRASQLVVLQPELGDIGGEFVGAMLSGNI